MFQLGIFDDNKGRKEGTESEKIVAWYPVTTEVDYQVRSIGLLQGLLQFLSIFDSAPGEVETAEFEDGYWVVGELSFPKFFMAIFVKKLDLGHHVTEWNLAGLIRNFDDILQLLVPDCSTQASNTLIKKVLKCFGENLSQKGSWLRKQLRNPFCLTHGVSCTDLPPGLSGLIAANFESHADVVIFRDNTCLYSSLDDEITALLGSFVISGVYGCFWQHPAPKLGAWMGSKSTTRFNVVEIKGKGQIFIIEQDSYLIFAGRKGQDDDLVASHLGRIAEDAMEAIEIWGGSPKISNHIPGSRYCVQEVIRKRHICSPREKVSSSSHHTRAVATTLLDHSTHLADKGGSIYVCDRTSDTWGVLVCDGSRKAVSVTIKGLSRRGLVDQFTASRGIHFSCPSQHECKD